MPIGIGGRCRDQFANCVVEVDRHAHDREFARILDSVAVHVVPEVVADLHRCGYAERLEITKTVRLAEQCIVVRRVVEQIGTVGRSVEIVYPADSTGFGDPRADRVRRVLRREGQRIRIDLNEAAKRRLGMQRVGVEHGCAISPVELIPRGQVPEPRSSVDGSVIIKVDIAQRGVDCARTAGRVSFHLVGAGGRVPPCTQDVASGRRPGDEHVVSCRIRYAVPQEITGTRPKPERQIVTEELDIGQLRIPRDQVDVVTGSGTVDPRVGPYVGIARRPGPGLFVI